eukprot:m.204360 g.204360  ORF g.204360 m.204360 type:complete len:576 (-) comp22494_c0_seq1:81-1808(-)
MADPHDEAIAMLAVGNTEDADRLLTDLGYRYRLASPLWQAMNPLVSQDVSTRDGRAATATTSTTRDTEQQARTVAQGRRQSGRRQPTQGASVATAGTGSSRTSRHGTSSQPHPLLQRVAVIDGALPNQVLARATHGLCLTAPFWKEHDYPTPAFFSYGFAMERTRGTARPKVPTGCIGDIAQIVIQQARHAGLLRGRGKTITHVEWWCHARETTMAPTTETAAHDGAGSHPAVSTAPRHGGADVNLSINETTTEAAGSRKRRRRADQVQPSEAPTVLSGGHQLHFDLDEKALMETGRIQSPAVSAVLYITGTGPPTLVTDEGISDATTHEAPCASAAVRVPPLANRLLLFDGSLLHGVPPCTYGDGTPRITLMMGLWSETPTLSKEPLYRPVTGNDKRHKNNTDGGIRGKHARLGPNMRHPRLRSKPSATPAPQWPADLIDDSSKSVYDDTDLKPHTQTHLLQVVSPVWSTTCGAAARGSSKARVPQSTKRQRKAKTDGNAPSSLYVGKWFVREPSEIRDEVVSAREWALGQHGQGPDGCHSDDDGSQGTVHALPEDAIEYVDAAELARLRAGMA